MSGRLPPMTTILTATGARARVPDTSVTESFRYQSLASWISMRLRRSQAPMTTNAAAVGSSSSPPVRAVASAVGASIPATRRRCSRSITRNDGDVRHRRQRGDDRAGAERHERARQAEQGAAPQGRANGGVAGGQDERPGQRSTAAEVVDRERAVGQCECGEQWVVGAERSVTGEMADIGTCEFGEATGRRRISADERLGSGVQLGERLHLGLGVGELRPGDQHRPVTPAVAPVGDRPSRQRRRDRDGSFPDVGQAAPRQPVERARRDDHQRPTDSGAPVPARRALRGPLSRHRAPHAPLPETRRSPASCSAGAT